MSVNNYQSISADAKAFWGGLSKKIVEQQTAFFDGCGDYAQHVTLTDDQRQNLLTSFPEAFVFRSPSDEDRDCQAKIFFEEERLKQAKSEFNALVKAQENGIERVPKPIGLHENILVETMSEGKISTKLHESTLIEHITEDQIVDLFKTFDALIRCGLYIDTYDHFLYDVESGFTVINFKETEQGKSNNFGKLLQELKEMFTNDFQIGALFDSALAKFFGQESLAPIEIAGSDMDYKNDFLPLQVQLQALIQSERKLNISYGDIDTRATLVSADFSAHDGLLDDNDNEARWRENGRYGTITLKFKQEDGNEIEIKDFAWKSLVINLLD